MDHAPRPPDNASPPPPADGWDLTHIYATLEHFEAALASAAQQVESLAALQATLHRGPGSLLAVLRTFWSAHQAIGTLRTYTHNHSNADTRHDGWQQRKGRVDHLYAAFEAASAWLDPELLAAGDDVRSWLRDEPELAPYRVPVERTLRRGPHTLDADQEKLLALTSEPHRAAFETFVTFTSAELAFDHIDVDGNSTQLTPSTFQRLRLHPDRAVRRQAFDGFYGSFGRHQATLGSLLTTTVRSHWGLARARGFSSCLEQALHAEFLPRAVVDTLISEVHAGRPTLHRYLRLRARRMQLDDLGYHDLYMPLVSTERSFDYATAKRWALASTAPLGSAYQQAVAEGLDGGWIDVYPRPGKVSGGYMSGGAFGVHPYILLNHNDTWGSVRTLAHEMGHAMHTALSQAHQPYPASNYAIFVAEVASTFHEHLLLHHLRAQASSRAERLFFLGEQLENLRSTFFRQAMFAEFELQLHEAQERGEPLTGASITERYRELLHTTFGHDEGVVRIADADAFEWAYIPHLHLDFYVYQYATSLAASSQLAQEVIDGVPGALDRHQALLRAGGSDDAHQLLVSAGIDLTQPEPYRALVRQMGALLDEMEQLLEE